MKDVLEKVGELHGRRFNQYDFQAVVYHHSLRSQDRWCYEDTDRAYVRWSGELPSFIKKLSVDDIAEARASYGARNR